jgi:pimeloyl-ACP methyl ester carboxylesterase
MTRHGTPPRTTRDHSPHRSYDGAVVSKHVDLDGPVHYVDFGGEGPPLVCVHGLAGSALNWMAVAPALARRHRVLAVDLRGFGRTPLGRGTRLRDNLHLLDLFLRRVAGAPATLLGNSMGGLLAVMQAAESPETVSRLVLADPALPWRGRRPFDRTVWGFFGVTLPPIAGEAVMGWRAGRWGARMVVDQVLASCCVDSGRVPADMVRALVDQETERLASPRSHRALAQATRSLLWALGHRAAARRYGDVRAPVLIVHGERDRLVPAAFSRDIARRHGWSLAVLPDVGHLPMMEAPEEFLRVTLPWLESQQTAAA